MGIFGEQMRGVFCLALAALVSQVQNIIFHIEHLFTLSLVPIAQQPGRAGVLGSPVSVSLIISMIFQTAVQGEKL
jgi:hypothetical protein